MFDLDNRATSDAPDNISNGEAMNKNTARSPIHDGHTTGLALSPPPHHQTPNTQGSNAGVGSLSHCESPYPSVSFSASRVFAESLAAASGTNDAHGNGHTHSVSNQIADRLAEYRARDLAQTNEHSHPPPAQSPPSPTQMLRQMHASVMQLEDVRIAAALRSSGEVASVTLEDQKASDDQPPLSLAERLKAFAWGDGRPSAPELPSQLSPPPQRESTSSLAQKLASFGRGNS